MKISEIKEFLKESNAIEGVYDDSSLVLAKVAWEYLIGQKELNDMVIKKTHYYLMEGKLEGRHIGYYRQCPVWIGGKEAIPFRTISESMDDWFALGEEAKIRGSDNPKEWIKHYSPG